jgi:2,3-bisphosphoglycerate-independent phosphoglycerate mutase
MNSHPPTCVLIILDGWGYREDPEFNAISAANTPYWDSLWKNCTHSLIDPSGLAVGLPEGQMGNSEVGHLHMGAGRKVYQDLTRIDHSIQSGAFFSDPTLIQAFETAEENGSAIHVVGLLSNGGVHSHESHLHALLKLAAQRNFPRLFIHVFLDGRDTPPKSAQRSLKILEETYHAKIVSLIGRYYAMDRDKRWDRTQKAYELLVEGKANYIAATASEGLEAAYKRGETDEFVQATVIGHPCCIEDKDSVIFFNFRSDRARQLSRALSLKGFSEFKRNKQVNLAHFVTFTAYADDIASEIIFPSLPLKNMLGEYLSNRGLKQLRLAETEKYAHVTFFFNGGVEKVFPRESRILVPSPKVSTYDHAPEMSALKVTEYLIEAIEGKNYDFIVCNFANPDMLGHTGDFNATVKAIEMIDDCLGKIVHALKKVGSEAIITADHGNAEYMFDTSTGQPHTAHTNELVPFVYVGRPANVTFERGSLFDIAPTILYLLGLEKPAEMTGSSLVEFREG